MIHVTMADVAAAAGVNKGTVSRALRGDKRISADTRERVWHAAKELGYELDAVASGLSSKRTGVVGVALEVMDMPQTGEFLSAVSGVLSRFKMELLLFDAGKRAGASAYITRRVESRKADGLIWVGDTSFEKGHFDIPVVRVGATQGGADHRVGLEQSRTTEAVRALAAGRPIVYRRGEASCMDFLSTLDAGSDENDGHFVIWDGVESASDGSVPDLVCGDERLARWLGVPCLRFPVRELGVLAARILTNAIRAVGVRPTATLVRPPQLSAAGEPVLAGQ